MAKPAPSASSGPSALESVSPSLARILRPAAAYRWLLPFVGSLTPQYIESVLRGALAGNHVQQWELFDLMLDTWPELSACQQELRDGVMGRAAVFDPFTEEDEDPTPAAIDRCKVVSAALRRMRPDPAADENNLNGTIADIVDGWFRGVSVLEVDWAAVPAGVHGNIIGPRATYWVHPVCFAFDINGRLGLRVDINGAMRGTGLGNVSAQPQPAALAPFPPHKFLIGIHKQKSGNALGGALLRPLAWWWCAANFSADWLLNLAQVFGLPFRWANYDPNAPQATIDAICNMLQNMGSAGWAAFPAGTTLELKDQPKGSDHSPQGELLDRADRYARLVILGQTMSGSQDASKGGGKAFGSVEADVKARRINAASNYVADVLNTQLIPSICVLNFGDADEAPTVGLVGEEDLEQRAAIVNQLTSAGAGKMISLDWLGKTFRIPRPGPDEETLGDADGPSSSDELDEETDHKGISLDDSDDDASLAAGEAAGHPFRGNQHVKGIHVTLPDEHWTGTTAELRAQAKAALAGMTGATHPTLGRIDITSKGKNKTLTDKVTPHQFQSVKALPQLIERGKHVGSAPDRKGRPDIAQFHTIEAGLRIGNMRYRAEVIVKEIAGQKTAHKFYLHRLHDARPLKTKSAAGPLLCTPAFQPERGPGSGEQTTPDAAAVKAIEATLSRVLAIDDDALFAKALSGLARTL